jgi:hypothetical protein
MFLPFPRKYSYFIFTDTRGYNESAGWRGVCTCSVIASKIKFDASVGFSREQESTWEGKKGWTWRKIFSPLLSSVDPIVNP